MQTKNTLLLAHMLLEQNIIKVDFDNLTTLKSGIVSPIYCNFREGFAYPDIRTLVARSFEELFIMTGIQASTPPEGILGVATGAISPATTLADILGILFGYVRPEPKAHGTKQMIEGMDVKGKRVIVIEDTVTTGGSLLKCAQIVREAGANSIFVASVFSYAIPGLTIDLHEYGFKMMSLIRLDELLPLIEKQITQSECLRLRKWRKDPKVWSELQMAKS